MNRWSQSHRRLALYYCYIFVLNAKECNFTKPEDERDNQGQQRQQQYSSSIPEEWVVRLEGGPEVASLLALRSGYRHIGPVLGFKDTYLWRATSGVRYKKRGMAYAMNALRNRAKILWAEQQKALSREKRGYERGDSIDEFDSDNSVEMDGEKRIMEEGIFSSSPHYDYSTEKLDRPKDRLAFNDELWEQEWYLVDRRGAAASERDEILDLNVLPVYELGVTGRGVRVAVLDDGLEYTHEDLRSNYVSNSADERLYDTAEMPSLISADFMFLNKDPEISYDITDRDDDPIPRYLDKEGNSHGTRCAGEIAMEADNGKCGVGVAFEAKIGGIKMLDGVVDDRVEAEALTYRSDLVDIYTASWGPPDDGRSLETPGRLASEALWKGVSEGRGGKGSIYVWASGNGGSKKDDCSCDGYVSSIYTIAIGSASQNGYLTWYGEICPATLATTYSSGTHQDQMIATTDLKNSCTTRHSGTSASAPLAAGILALALQVNNNLTWRDVQHLVALTSNHKPLGLNPGWFRNAVGFWYNPRFGFGLMDAYALVAASANWTVVPTKSICGVLSSMLITRNISYGRAQRIKFESDGCYGATNEIQYLEHVQIEINIEYSIRGALQIHLTAPSGTRVQILGKRTFDNSTEGFNKWKFMSVATWGENPRGTWYLDIIDEVGPSSNRGSIGSLYLILHGTKERPDYIDKILSYKYTLNFCKLQILERGEGIARKLIYQFFQNHMTDRRSNVPDESDRYENCAVTLMKLKED